MGKELMTLCGIFLLAIESLLNMKEVTANMNPEQVTTNMNLIINICI